MTKRTFSITLLLALFAWFPDARAEGLPTGEKAKIEALLSHVSGLGDAKFIRNGKEYDAKTAAKFLRGKWEANEEKIHSASDFIAVAATRSSTTGKPYLIRLTGQQPTPCAGYLTAQLKKLEAGNGK